MKSVRDIVTGQDVVTVNPLVPVAEAARIMAARHIGAVPVADAGRIVGIFTERDALTRVVAAGIDPVRTPVREVMSSTLVAADIGESCEACLDRMRQAHIRHLIVLDHRSDGGYRLNARLDGRRPERQARDHYASERVRALGAG